MAVAVLILAAAAVTATESASTSARLRDGRVPAQVPYAYGGGEVAVELTVDSRGRVTRVEPVRITPPFVNVVVNAVAGWRFTPATAVVGGRARSVGASVLAIAVFRPPVSYAGPAPGVPPQVLRSPSPRVPGVESIALPAYPPTATGDGAVLVEIEMTSEAEPRDYRIVGPASGFDAAALEAVRAWRFTAPTAPDIPDLVFAYAVVGFRAPLTPLPDSRD